MPNFLNSFKMDDFVDRKNKKTKRIFSDCGLNDLNDFKQGLFAFYIKDKKDFYDKHKEAILNYKQQKEALEKHLNEMKDAKKEDAQIKADAQGKRMEEQAKNKELADEKANSFMDDIFGKVIDLNEKGQNIEDEKKPRKVEDDKYGIGEKLIDFWEDVFADENNKPVPEIKVDEPKANANLYAEIKPNEKALYEEAIKKGLIFNDKNKLDMNALLEQMNAMSAEEKKKLGSEFMEYLDEKTKTDRAEDWKDDLPTVGDYSVDFMEEVDEDVVGVSADKVFLNAAIDPEVKKDKDKSKEDANKKENEIKNDAEEKVAEENDENEITYGQIIQEMADRYSEQLMPKLTERLPYKDDKETLEGAGNKSEAGEGKLWYALVHQAKIKVYDEVDYDYFNDNELDPTEYGLPEELEISDEERDLASSDIKNAIDSLNIKDRESALAALIKLETIKNKIHYEIGSEALRVERVLGDEDCKDAKADYLVSQGQSVPLVLDSVYRNVADEVKSQIIKNLPKSVHLSEGMTMNELADVMGLSEAEKIEYFDSRFCNGYDSVKDVFGKKYNINKILQLVEMDYANRVFERLQKEAETAANNGISLYENNLIQRGRNISKGESDFSDERWEETVGRLITRSGYSQTQAIESFVTLSEITANGVELDGKKLSGPKNIFAPMAKSGKKEAKNTTEKSAAQLAEQILDDKLVKERQDALEAERVANINDWEKQFKPGKGDDWGSKRFKPDQAAKMAEETNIYAAWPTKLKITNLAKTLIPGENQKGLYEGINLQDASLTMISTQYMLWLIATKDATVKNVLEVGDNENNKKEFLDFCHKNPSGDKGEYENNARWAIVYRNAFDKIKNYQMPDMDYSDISKVKEHIEEIAVMCAIADNGTKLMDRTFAGDARIIAETEIGKDKYNDIYGFMRGLDAFLRPLNNAYIDTPAVRLYMEQLEKNLKGIAIERFIAGKRMDGYAGKNLEDIVNDSKFKNGNQYLKYNDEVFKNKVLDPTMYPEIKHLDRETALDMLKFSSGFIGRMDVLEQIYAENDTTVNNVIYHSNVMDFRQTLNAGRSHDPYPGMVNNLLNTSKVATEMNEAIAKEGIKGKAYRDWLKDKVDELADRYMSETLKERKQHYSDLFTVNGRPFEEYFQEKKAKVEIPAFILNEKDQKKKEEMLKDFNDKQKILDETKKTMFLREAINDPNNEVRYTGCELEMYDFLKHRGYSGVKTYDWLSKVTSELLKGGMKETFEKNKIQISDIFLVGGESPKKLYGSKYDFVNNPAEKEQLIQLEIINEIFKGEKEVAIKDYLIDKNEKLTESGTIKMFASKEIAEKMIVGADALGMGIRNIRRELEKYKQKLIEALPYKEYTYTKIENGEEVEYIRDETKAEKEQRVLTAGTTLYKNMAKALNDAIRITSDPNATAKEIRDALCAFQRSASNYYKERRGLFFGPRSEYGQKRLALAEDARKGTLDFLMMFDNLRRDLNIDHSFGYKNVTTGEASIKDIQDEIIALNKSYGDLYDMRSEGRTAEFQNRFENLKDVSRKQNELLALLVAENPGKIHMDYRKTEAGQMVTDKKDQSLLQYAKNYVSKKYIDEMMKKGNKPEDVQELIDYAKAGNLEVEAINLTHDEAFRNIVRDYPNDYYDKMRWEEDVRLGNARKASADRKISRALTLLGEVNQAGFSKSISEDPWIGQVRDYDKLTNIVMAQIISSPEYEKAIYDKRLGDKDLVQASAYLKKAFQSVHVFDGMNSIEMDIAFADGQFKKFAVDVLTNKANLKKAAIEHLGIKEFDMVKVEFPAHDRNYDAQKKKEAVKATKLSNKGAHRKVDGLVLDGNKEKVDAIKAEEKNEIKRSNSLVIKGENKGKVKGRKRSGSVNKKNNNRKPGI